MIAPFLFLGRQLNAGKAKDESLATEAKRGSIDPSIIEWGAIERQNRPRLLGEV